MERIEREIAAGRIPISIMYRRSSQHQDVVYRGDDDFSTGDEWSEESSVSSECTGSESSEAEWEPSVNTRGELIYIDCHPPAPLKKGNKENESTFQRTKSRRSKRGKFLRLIRRRESKRRSKRMLPSEIEKKNAFHTNSDSASGSNKVTFRDCQEGEVREVTIIVDPKSRLKYGRRLTISEAVLGLMLSSFSDGSRIMVAGFIPEGEAIKHRNIKIGDWLKSINDREVNVKTIDIVVDKIKNPCTVRLKLQRIAGVEVTTEPPPNKIPKQPEIVRHLVNPSIEDDNEVTEFLCKLPVGILFLTTEGLSETGPEYEGVYYCYPGPLKENALCRTRGAFITLFHLLPSVMNSVPLVSTILLKDTLTHIIYTAEETEIMLLALPDNRCSACESMYINAELVRTLKFMYQSLNRCFLSETNISQLDHFFARFFARLLSSSQCLNAPQIVEVNELEHRSKMQSCAQFEDILQAAHKINLPRDIQLDIDDCLNDMEACDYREWNEDPMDCQRLYTIIGSALYCSGYLLTSHFSDEDLIDVHSFCRQQGLLHLFHTESMRNFVLWREVYPLSCNRGLNDKSLVSGGYRLPNGRWFLLIVGYDQDMLAVIFEAGGCTVPAEGNPGPDPFYVEEVQDTLIDIQSIGVTEIAKRWLAANVFPQVIIPEMVDNKNKRTDFFGSFGLTKSSEISPSTSKFSPSTFTRKPEVTSILKRRNSPERAIDLPHTSSPVYPTNSDISDESRSFRSFSSDDPPPVIGRREARERGAGIEDESESGSEWGTSRGASQSGSSLDLSDLRHALLTEIDSVLPIKVTSGEENVLFHYVKLDTAEGVLLCSATTKKQQNDIYLSIMNNFRRCSQIIHNLFQKTMRFKNLLNHDTEKSVINKSLVAIKEHGILFQCSTDEKEMNKKNYILKYWVVGRLFSDPNTTELYVCYDENTPQNLIEIAFRLGLLYAG